MADFHALVHEATESSVLYASAADDTRALTFTHPTFLKKRGATRVGNVGVYVLLDSAAPADDPHAPLAFHDDQTTIQTEGVERGTLFGFPAWRLLVAIQSDLGDRKVDVVRVRSENEAFAPRAAAAGWVPHVFIGVCDGCRLGGNKHCVNRLTTWGLAPDEAARIRLPRWWITDHFPPDDAQIPATLAIGAVVEATDPAFPVCFRKIALLSTAWGRYGRGAIGGATVFETLPRRTSPRPRGTTL